MSHLTEQEVAEGERLCAPSPLRDKDDPHRTMLGGAALGWLEHNVAALLAAARENLTLRAEVHLLRDPVSPSNLRDLGEYLARLLDEDRWPSAERKLNAALSEQNALRAELASVSAERDALRAVLIDARAALCPPSVRFEAGYPLPAHLRITSERAQLLGRIDAAIDAARKETSHD